MSVKIESNLGQKRGVNRIVTKCHMSKNEREKRVTYCWNGLLAYTRAVFLNLLDFKSRLEAKIETQVPRAFSSEFLSWYFVNLFLFPQRYRNIF